jgi:hypothetical protein
VDVRDYDKMRLVPHKGKAYEPRACAKFFMALLERADIKRTATQGALELIRRVLDGEVPTEDIEFTDTPVHAEQTTTTEVNGISQGTRSTILAAICAELKIESTVARRKLRKAGLHAPYDNEVTIRGALK